MTRPVPLFRAPELLTLIEPGPLTDDYGAHGNYLEQHLAGDAYIIGGNSPRLHRLAAFASDVPSVESVTTCINDTGNDAQIQSHDLGIPTDWTFDTVIYTKETTSWFGRSNDFQRLTPHVAPGGTLLAKSKWVPDSNRVELSEIAVAGACEFTHPQVYLRYDKTATQPSLTEAVYDTVEPADAGEGRDHTPRTQASRIKHFETQFPETARQTEFSPGWSWHARLTDYVATVLQDVDGPVANLCCGSSTLGDVRVDKLSTYTDGEEETETTATHIADATALPFNDNQFAGVVTDPPWKVAPETRVRLFSEAVRVTEPGGLIVQNSWWIPHHPYTSLAGLRPVLANITEDSLGGPGGLSFLASYRVAEQPDFGPATYTLADHMEAVGLNELTVYQDWPYPRPAESPRFDPRFIGHPEYRCVQCGTPALVPRDTKAGPPVYECRDCCYRSTAGELVDSVTNACREEASGTRSVGAGEVA